MKTNILSEYGYKEALLGISLSFEQEMDKMPAVARNLAWKQGGHNKFLESMVVWVDINAPRYWWQQFDTYRVGTTKQSGSTMHTLMKRKLTQEDFEGEMSEALMNLLESMRLRKDFDGMKKHLPESFLQRRVVCTNYKVLQNMAVQRMAHKLDEWRWFINEVLKQVEYPEFIWRVR